MERAAVLEVDRLERVVAKQRGSLLALLNVVSEFVDLAPHELRVIEDARRLVEAEEGDDGEDEHEGADDSECAGPGVPSAGAA